MKDSYIIYKENCFNCLDRFPQKPLIIRGFATNRQDIRPYDLAILILLTIMLAVSVKEIKMRIAL